jgi:hypothetical protein
MPENKTTAKKSHISKDDILQTITEHLLSGLGMIKEQLGDKKYEKRIKKAAKLLAEGIKNNSPKKPDETAKKSAQKKEEAPKSKTTIKVAASKPVTKIAKVKKTETAVKNKAKK